MKIGIIGAGYIGGTLARRWVELGHEVVIANSRGPETLKEVAAETGAKAGTPADAVKGAEVVVVTIPEKAVRDLPKGLFANVPKEVVVIDTGNYYPVRDGAIPEVDAGMVESEWVAEQLGRPVIKVFNNIFFKSLLEKGAPKGTPGRIALPVAGNSPEAKAKVLQLVEALGFDAIDAGGIADSWRQQPGTPCYTQDLDAPRLKQALAEADRALIPTYRQKSNDWLKQYIASLPKS
ncbi:NADP oxidoreductase [Corallococcus praedator]|uniref:NADP oxidoreductase n=1 Tax=Corallococcus praedator TaxID=2316724 RepID=A0ABX9QKF5_9BACT|nr:MULTISPECIES: NAD(P)-binding domain-containing protein [Corallococcus]RKH30600.1 NADP oxidoreductase [Corallococcus sp. CA031C]RKI08781.1 NADP oxidoreductase [Corallococcus praedator]